ncbi:MAG: guanylate kinase [Thermoguttaceae bacterium]|nr:guanylate kinase [Thermoguttaceae bacterium]
MSAENSKTAKRGRLLIVSGPSGVGKGTILKALFALDEFPLTLSVSATTRAPRAGELDGADYHFLSKDEFLRRKDKGEFLECFEVFAGGDWYGTLRAPVEELLADGRVVVLEIDVKGAREVLKTYPDALTVFILPPSIETLRQRLEGRRSETPESLQRRLAQAESEIAHCKEYRLRVVNDSILKAANQLAEFLRANIQPTH